MRWIFAIILFSCFSVVITNCKQKASPEYSASLEQHRLEYKKHFKENERAPLRTDDELSKMDFFPADEKYNCTCKLEQKDAGNIITISTYAGKEKQYRNFGKAKCVIDGTEFDLTMFQYAQAFGNPIAMKQLFLPFKDHTNGETTYGGGRYMDLSTDDIKDGSMVLDFNKAYNPWCAYADGYNCPIPPVSNHLNFEIRAGEKLYLEEQKKG